jgi:hypothetical protein
MMIMGTHAILGGNVNSFWQMLTVTNICATDHNKFFLTFVERMTKIPNEFIHLPCDMPKEVATVQAIQRSGITGLYGVG